MGYRKLTMLDMYYNMYIYSNAPRKMETQLTTDLEVFLLSYLLRDYYIYRYSTVHTIIYHIEVYLLNSILYVYVYLLTIDPSVFLSF